jgi:hypothetical protein
MDISSLIRDAKRVNAALEELADLRLVCNRKVKIYIPASYVNKDLAYVGVDTYILGIYAITVDDKYYGVSLVNAMLNIDPTETNRIKINGDDYIEFVFMAGSTVVKNLMLVKTDMLAYKIYDEIFSSGNVPWFIGYEELGRIFDTALLHAGANIGGNQEVTQLIASIVARDPLDRTKYYRTKIKDLKELETDPPVYVPLRSVTYSATNTTNKLGGSYMNEGIISALVTQSVRRERIEQLLRT